MKTLLISFVLIAFTGFSQDWSKQLEFAKHEVNFSNDTAYSTIISNNSGTFSEDDFKQIKDEFAKKESIFAVMLISGGNSVKVYHLSAATYNVLEDLLVRASEDFDFSIGASYVLDLDDPAIMLEK